MVDVYLNYGCVILTTIVVMIPMSQHTCAVKEIVQQDGRDVQDNQTIVAFQNGYSVMAKMTVEITAMNCLKTVQFAIQKQISSAKTTAAFLNNGLAV